MKQRYENRVEQSDISIESVHSFLLQAAQTSFAYPEISDHTTTVVMKSYDGVSLAGAARKAPDVTQTRAVFEAGTLERNRMSREIMLGYWSLNIITAQAPTSRGRVVYDLHSIAGLEEQILYATRVRSSTPKNEQEKRVWYSSPVSSEALRQLVG